MLGVTKPVTLRVMYNKSGIHPYTNNYVSGFTAETAIKRSEFGMNAFEPAVGDTISVHMEVEGIDPVKHPGNAKTPN
jgi:polyisoprenoid-binding protein YceI